MAKKRSVVIIKKIDSYFKRFYSSFYGWGYRDCRAFKAREPLWGDSLLFTTKSPEILGTYLIDLKRMKGWIDLGSTKLLWTRAHWVINPAPSPLDHRLLFHRIKSCVNDCFIYTSFTHCLLGTNDCFPKMLLYTRSNFLPAQSN